MQGMNCLFCHYKASPEGATHCERCGRKLGAKPDKHAFEVPRPKMPTSRVSRGPRNWLAPTGWQVFLQFVCILTTVLMLPALFASFTIGPKAWLWTAWLFAIDGIAGLMLLLSWMFRGAMRDFDEWRR
jgi:hypothetical protein